MSFNISRPRDNQRLFTICPSLIHCALVLQKKTGNTIQKHMNYLHIKNIYNQLAGTICIA